MCLCENWTAPPYMAIQRLCAQLVNCAPCPQWGPSPPSFWQNIAHEPALYHVLCKAMWPTWSSLKNYHSRHYQLLLFTQLKSWKFDSWKFNIRKFNRWMFNRVSPSHPNCVIAAETEGSVAAAGVKGNLICHCFLGITTIDIITMMVILISVTSSTW